MKRLAIAASLTLSLVGRAHADPEPPAPDALHTSTALGLAIATPLVGVGLVYAGERANSDAMVITGLGMAVLGPSAGHWYARQPLTIGLVMRAAGAAMVVGGVVDALGECSWSGTCKGNGAGVLVVGGGALLVGGAVYDLVTTPSAVDDYNRRRRQLSLVPTMLVGPGDQPAAGLVLAGRF